MSGGKGSVPESVNDEAVYRKAPATPGLLNMIASLYLSQSCSKPQTTKIPTEERLSNNILHYMCGTSQEEKRPKNWDFYPLRFGFS